MAAVQLTPIANAALPKLAWFAEVDLDAGLCTVEHGPFVEVDPTPGPPEWVAAAVWDGPFSAGGFHRSEHVFGSGIRVDGEQIHFVPPCTTLDRLFYLRMPGRLYVGNSLIVFLARLDIRLSTGHNHQPWSEGICLGRYGYLSDIPVQGNNQENIRQLVFDNLVVHHDVLRFESPNDERAFTGYDDYLEALDEALGSLWANATDQVRQRQSRAVSTASRGYDSPAVTALVSKLAPVDCYSAAHSTTRIPKILRPFLDDDVADDDGSDIAAHLGTRPIRLDLNPQAVPKELELWLWASAQVAPELLFYRLFEHAERSGELTLWFAGHGGDSVWEVLPYDPRIPTATLYRGAPSGLALAEARIRYGVIDVSVPYLFATSIRHIAAINTSKEMSPWRFDNSYDRPIPRRILEDRGIPRGWFGFGKKMVVQDFDSPQGTELRADFFTSTRWNSVAERGYRGVNLTVYGAGRLSALIASRGNRIKMMDYPSPAKNTLERLMPRLGLRRATFLYCTNTLADKVAPRPSGPLR